MPITVIPADDRGDREGLGLSLLAQAQENAKLRRERQTADYADLVKFLSNPNTSEEEQNAVLTMDPKAFQSKYGVPITRVGKDVSTFANTADTPAVLKRFESPTAASTKRIVREQPGGTPVAQQAAATLAQTKENVAAEQQKRAYYEQAVKLNEQQGMIELSNARQAIKKGFRNPTTGGVPTLNETNAFLKGDLDLNPTTETATKLEAIRTIFDGDENDPAFRYLQLSLLNDQDMSTAQLEKLKAETEAIKTHQTEQEERNRLLQSNIDPDTGKSLSGDQAVDPAKIVQVSKAFDEAMFNSLKSLGAASGASKVNTVAATGWKSIGPIARYFQRAQEYPGFTEAIFGNGVADPAAVRADLQRLVGKDRTATSLKIPTFDKNGLPIEATMPIDQAVVAITQARRALATSLPPLFKAMEGVSPRSLIEITQGNPIVLQAARAYAPTLAKAIDEARAQMATKMTADAAAAAVAADPNTAPLAAAVDRLQKEVDEARRMLSGQANPTPTAPPSNRNALEQPER